MKNILLLLILAITASLACRAQAPVDNRKQAVIFKSVNVVTMDSERILENQDVTVRDGKIVAIAPTGKSKEEKGALICGGQRKIPHPRAGRDARAHTAQRQRTSP